MSSEERDATQESSCLELLAHELQTALAKVMATRHAGETGIVPAYFAFFGLFGLFVREKGQILHELRVA